MMEQRLWFKSFIIEMQGERGREKERGGRGEEKERGEETKREEREVERLRGRSKRETSKRVSRG